jgi:TPR repeat protein
VRVVNASLAVAANSDAATSALVQGEKLFAKGDVEEARQRFEQAAKMGMPEAALALGNTYDRVSLAKAGLNVTGDPTRARQWYRRALELAQIHPEPRQ